MFKILIISASVLILQTGFYLKAGSRIELPINSSTFKNKEYSEPKSSILDSKEVLFVVRHSKSPNMVVYEAKRTAKKEFDPKKPVDVYWLMKTKGATTEALTLIEWKMAFGFKLQTISKGKSYKINLNAIKNKEIIITQNQHGEVEGLMKLNGILTKLKDVFIEFEYSLFWPDVKYVEFKGIDLATGKIITQRFSKS